MKEQSEMKMDGLVKKDNCLRIPNITRNLFLSHLIIEIIAIEVKTFLKDEFQKAQIGGI